MANINEAWIISQAFIGASLYRPQNFGEKLYGPLHLTFKKKKKTVFWLTTVLTRDRMLDHRPTCYHVTWVAHYKLSIF